MPNTTFQIGGHRRAPQSAIAIPATIVQHTVNQIMIQGRKLVTDLSKVQFFESFDAVRMGVPAIARGAEIHFAPGAFQPHTEAGRKLIEEQLVPLTPLGPVPIPSPNASTSTQASPTTSNVQLNMVPNINLPAPPTPGATGPVAPSMMKPMIGGHRF